MRQYEATTVIAVSVKLVLVSLLCLISSNAAEISIVAYSNNFETGGITGFSGAGIIEATGGYSGLGFGSQFLRNDTSGDTNSSTDNAGEATTLTLTDLQTHDSIDLNFFLAIIDSWDGNNGPCCAPDFLHISVDGVSFFKETFTVLEASQGRTQSYSAPSGGLLSRNTHLGYNGQWVDEAYNMGLDTRFYGIAHASDTIEISFWASSFFGWQGEWMNHGL